MIDTLEEAALGDGWRVWNAETDRVILAYRPDVFDGGEFPAACMPTLYVTHGQRNRRPGEIGRASCRERV